MGYMECVRSLQLLISEGLVHVNDQGYFLAMKLDFLARSGFHGLSYFIAICFNWILMTAGRRPLGFEAMAIFLLIFCCVGSTITGASGEHVNEANIQSWIYVAPHVWEIIRNYALHALAVVTTLVSMVIIGVFIGRGMFENRPILPPIPMPIDLAPVPAMPAIPTTVQALPMIPAVQGDNIDDVLGRAPIPTRLNSPLSWL